MSETTREQIRDVIGAHANLPVDIRELGDAADLFAAGMTSFASVNVMLGLEDTFDVEFPDTMLKRSVFASVDAILEALEALGVALV
ncbi:acyl carrier protein [Conexibacter sp. DBS9H8]|uniref:acyl carrier protein n=1 Tax=Conexibacter sp. DBS9H8 TaxID=2937801 RepID=UPI00200FB014|nr:acyl carrier protein [Conexibacter sp. DBS9H8]